MKEKEIKMNPVFVQLKKSPVKVSPPYDALEQRTSQGLVIEKILLPAVQKQ